MLPANLLIMLQLFHRQNAGTVPFQTLTLHLGCHQPELQCTATIPKLVPRDLFSFSYGAGHYSPCLSSFEEIIRVFHQKCRPLDKLGCFYIRSYWKRENTSKKYGKTNYRVHQQMKRSSDNSSLGQPITDKTNFWSIMRSSANMAVSSLNYCWDLYLIRKSHWNAHVSNKRFDLLHVYRLSKYR